MFIAALFAVAKMWKQPKYSSDMRYVYTHTHIYTYTYNGLPLSCKKEWNFAICSNIGESRGHYAKWYVRQILYDITYM